MSGDSGDSFVAAPAYSGGGVAFDAWGPGSSFATGGSCGEGSILGNAPSGSVGADGSLNFNQMCYGDGASGAVATSDSLPLVPNITDGGGGFNNITTGFDSNKSVSQNLTDGTFKQSDAKAPEHTPVADGQQPKISVTSDTSKPADFKVKADGTIEVNGNPDLDGRPHSEYKIAVEPGADQAKTDALVGYLKDRIGKTGENVNPTLDAEAGLVSDNLRKRFDPGSDNSDQDTEDLDDGGGVDDGGGCDGGGGGGGGGGGDDTDLDPDNDTIDDTNKPDDKQPPTDQTTPRGPMDGMRDAFRVSDYQNMSAGRLGAFEHNVGNWFQSCLTPEMLAELGNPPDWSKLGKVMAKYAKDPKFQAKMGEKMQAMKDNGDTAGADKMGEMFNKLGTDENFANGFGDFLKQQDAGVNATPDQMNTYFNKDMQNAVQSSQMSDISKEMGVKLKDMNDTQVADLALALASKTGHVVPEADKAQLMKMPGIPEHVNQIVEHFKSLRKPAS